MTDLADRARSFVDHVARADDAVLVTLARHGRTGQLARAASGRAHLADRTTDVRPVRVFAGVVDLLAARR